MNTLADRLKNLYPMVAQARAQFEQASRVADEDAGLDCLQDACFHQLLAFELLLGDRLRTVGEEQFVYEADAQIERAYQAAQKGGE